MKKVFTLILIFTFIFSLVGCKKPGPIDNKQYNIKLNIPNENWNVSKLSIPQTQIIEKKGTLGTVSIMSTKVEDKDVSGVSKKSIDDIFSIIKSKTSQKKTGITVKDIGSKTLNNITWRGMEITFKMPGNIGTIVQTMYIAKKGKSAFIVALHSPPSENTDSTKDLETALLKAEFPEAK
jgi:hypothetical protein